VPVFVRVKSLSINVDRFVCLQYVEITSNCAVITVAENFHQHEELCFGFCGKEIFIKLASKAFMLWEDGHI